MGFDRASINIYGSFTSTTIVRKCFGFFFFSKIALTFLLLAIGPVIRFVRCSSQFPSVRLHEQCQRVGKRLLPLGIRSAFTEFFVGQKGAADQLRLIIRGQIPTMGEQSVDAVLQFYTEVRALFPAKFKWVQFNVHFKKSLNRRCL